MKVPTKFRSVLLCFLVIFPLTAGCSAFKSLPFFSTQTPYPNLYSLSNLYPPSRPTPTPIPSRWSVEVTSVTFSLAFGGWQYDTDQNAHFLIVTIQYTYQGSEATSFSPESVVLLLSEDTANAGIALATGFYQPEGNTVVTNFSSGTPVLLTLSPGQTKTESFGWALTITGDTHFKILFPETNAIDLVVEN